MSCYGLKEFSLSTNLEAECPKLAKIIVTQTIKDYVMLSFDLNLYSDLTYQQIFTLNTKMPLGVLRYLKVKDKIIYLKKLFFIYLKLIF